MSMMLSVNYREYSVYIQVASLNIQTNLIYFSNIAEHVLDCPHEVLVNINLFDINALRVMQMWNTYTPKS